MMKKTTRALDANLRKKIAAAGCNISTRMYERGGVFLDRVFVNNSPMTYRAALDLSRGYKHH